MISAIGNGFSLPEYGPQARILKQAIEQASGALSDVMELTQMEDRPGVMDALDAALNLSDGASLMQVLGEMAPEEAEGALKTLARLLQKGIVGYEYRKVNGEPQKVFIDVAIGSDLHRAPLVRDEGFDQII
ncbi:MAG: hypothetical protein O7G87_18755 [bacterium]|nr:hypothetical protein [bacterium]